MINGVAGGLAGAVTATFVCPLDVLKTRLQVQRRVPGVKYHSIGGAHTFKFPLAHPFPALLAHLLACASNNDLF